VGSICAPRQLDQLDVIHGQPPRRDQALDDPVQRWWNLQLTPADAQQRLAAYQLDAPNAREPRILGKP
jgi:hypothetical protein